MLKTEFLECLRRGISTMPQEEIEECVTFYGEMIDDRMEEGLSEEIAVMAVGSVDEIVLQILSGRPMITQKEMPKKREKRRMRTWEIVLLAIGSPLWLVLLLAALSVVLALCVSLWAVLLSFWAMFASLVGTAFGVTVMGGLYAVLGNGTIGLAAISAGLVCAGLAIFAFFGCQAASKGVLWLSKKTFLCGKACWRKKEGEQ